MVLILIKHFNLVLTLLLVWCNIATSETVKSTLKHRCVCQRWNLKCWKTWNQFNVDIINIRQRWNSVVILTTLINIERRLKSWKEQKSIFNIKKKKTQKRKKERKKERKEQKKKMKVQVWTTVSKSCWLYSPFWEKYASSSMLCLMKF